MLHTPSPSSPVKFNGEPRARRRGPHSPPPDATLTFPYPFPYFNQPPLPTPPTERPGYPFYHSPPAERPASPPAKRRRVPFETRLYPAEPEPSSPPLAVTSLSLDPRWYPGVFGLIASHATRDTLLSLRLVSRDARDAAEKMLFSHVVVKRKCPGKEHPKMDLSVLISPKGERLPALPMDYSPFAPRPRMSRAFKHIRTVDYPSHTVALPPTITRQLVFSANMTRRLGWNYGALDSAQQVHVCRTPLRKSVPEAFMSMGDATKKQVMVIPWNEHSSGEPQFSSPRTLDLDELAFSSVRRGGECVFIFRPECIAAIAGAASPASSPSSTDAGAASAAPFLLPIYLLIASLIRQRYTLVGLEDLPRRLMKSCRDPAKEPCPAKRVASMYHFVAAAVCMCWNMAGRDDERTVDQLFGRLRLLTREQYRAEIGAKQYALESYDTPVDGPADAEIAKPDDCECGTTDCGRTEEYNGVQLEGDWGEIVRQVLMASAVAKS